MHDAIRPWKPGPHEGGAPRAEVSQARAKPPMDTQLTHFAYWSCGVLLQTTPDRYAEEVRKIERLIGPPWLKGINRVHGRYEPLP